MSLQWPVSPLRNLNKGQGFESDIKKKEKERREGPVRETREKERETVEREN